MRQLPPQAMYRRPPIPVSPPVRLGSNMLTMLSFGRMGRFGNQVFQYSFLKTYAAQYNLLLQIPPWVGNILFGARDLGVTIRLPRQREKYVGTFHDQPLLPDGAEYINRDFYGYAQYHTSYYAPRKEHLRKLFTPVDQVRTRLEPALRRLRDRGKTIIGLHLRRGDYGRLNFYITPVAWYLRWLEEHWSRFVDPVLFIATEALPLLVEFAKFKPVVVEDLGVTLRDVTLPNYNYLKYDLAHRDPRLLDFYPDFHVLSHCDVLVAPNSTFSFAAAMLNPHLREFWRSSLPLASFEKLDLWNTTPLTYERAEDYRHLDGVCLASNPQWA